MTIIPCMATKCDTVFVICNGVDGEVMVVVTDRIFLSVCVDRVGLDKVISVPRHVRFWMRLSLEAAV